MEKSEKFDPREKGEDFLESNENLLIKMEKSLKNIVFLYKKFNTECREFRVAELHNNLAGLVKWACFFKVVGTGVIAEAAGVHPWKIDPKSPEAVTTYLTVVMLIIAFLHGQFSKFKKEQAFKDMTKTKKEMEEEKNEAEEMMKINK